MTNDLIKSAKEIIEKILYITIATVSEEGQPWNTPVYAVHDENYNFYWSSDVKARHSKNISSNPNLFLVIYDSSDPEAWGVFIKATAKLLESEEEVNEAKKYYLRRQPNPDLQAHDFLGTSDLRMYKATLEKVWRNIYPEVGKVKIDKRVEIKLT